MNRLVFLLCLVSCLLCACNFDVGSRFQEQEADYVFTSNSTTLTAYGATRIAGKTDQAYRCPAVSGLNRDSDVSVFFATAHSLLPHFTIESIQGIRSDTAPTVGVSLSNLPMGMLDIYRRCNASSQERFVTSCPSNHTIVEACPEGTMTQNECVLVHEGTHRLVISAMHEASTSCYSGESNRTSYSVSAPDVVYACDTFSPVDLAAAYRGAQPSGNCCDVTDQSLLDFCLRPCGCRKLVVQIVPKSDVLSNNAPDSPAPSFSPTLRLAVFSNVSGNRNRFRQLLKSLKSYDVQMVISLGNLTANGSAGGFEAFRTIVDEALTTLDGTDCSTRDGQICCASQISRDYPQACNAIVHQMPFFAGLGEAEINTKGLTVFRSLFGSSVKSTTIGKVQMVLLDSADATLGNSQLAWLERQIKNVPVQTCNIPAPREMLPDECPLWPSGQQQWPTLSECEARSGQTDPQASKELRCSDCICAEAYCVTPDAERSNPRLGPRNCVCVPATSKICMYNQSCPVEDGQSQTCICTRDQDCGTGGTCLEGVCQPPMRLIFSYTPFFDIFGSRNSAFSSRREAATVLSRLTNANTAAVFSGRSLEFAHYEMGGIPLFITGGGGADMAAFSSYGNHWLLIEIPDAYTKPDPSKMTVEVIPF
ncbi:MAG: hypothetical protein FWC40_00350 [Proteobacteria bacterium]|nr:hypothetical protein [Pseudomonadota bacterium]